MQMIYPLVNQNLVRHHIFEREHHGLLTGSALTDVKITLLQVVDITNIHLAVTLERQHIVHSTRIRKSRKCFTEPYYDFKIKVDMD